MKKIVVYICITLLFITNACSQQNNIEIGKVYEHVILKNNTSLSYAIYLPKKKSSLAIIFFDPHGNGAMPIHLYKNIAEEYGITLIGNNNSSNGADFNSIATNFSILLYEIKSDYKIKENDVALWGFSGGAKAAMFNAGLNNKIDYCVYGGSVIKNQNNVELLGFNGKHDMNYTDLFWFTSNQEQYNPKHFQIAFAGKHAWPDTTTAKDAFRWFLLKKMQKKEIPIDKQLITTTYNSYKKEVDKLILSKQYVDAFWICKKAQHFLNTLTNISYFKTKETYLASTTLFKQQSDDLYKNLEKESKIKLQYQTDIFNKDTAYWKKEIADLWQKSTTDKSGIYSRLLGFLSLAGYSYANRAIQANDINSLEKILFIYHYADPTNPEQAFMRAQLYVQKNEIEKAKQALQEAILLGIDKNRIKNDVMLKTLQ